MPSLASSIGRLPRPLRRLLSLGATLLLLAALATLVLRPNRTLHALLSWSGTLNRGLPPARLSIDGDARHALESGELRRLLDLPPDRPLAAIDLPELRRRLDALPFTSSTVLERRYPATLVVRLDERKPVAVWQTGDRFALIDAAGEIVGYAGGPDRMLDPNLDLPLVVGTGAADATPALLSSLKLAPAFRAALSAAVRIGGRRWDLVLRNGCTVQMPEGDVDGALAKLQALEAQDRILERPIRVIDARTPGRLVIRADPPKPAAPDAAAPAPNPGPAPNPHPAAAHDPHRG